MDTQSHLLAPRGTDSPAQRSARASLAAAVTRRDELRAVIEYAARRLRDIAALRRHGALPVNGDIEQRLVQLGHNAAIGEFSQADSAVHEYLRELGEAAQIGGAS